MQLIQFPSVSALSNREIADFLYADLESLGGEIESITYQRDGQEKVCLVSRFGSGRDGLAYMGHMDVVPVTEWQGPGRGGFDPVIRDGRLYGRGSCDMKGSLACFLTALRHRAESRWNRPLYVVFTSDEETGQQGAAAVHQNSRLFRELRSHRCGIVIGEPTSLRVVGAHKGTCLIRVVAHGRAAHSGGTEGRNANLAMIPFLTELKAIYDETTEEARWQDARFDPSTLSMNIGINDFTAAVNITPPQSVCTIFFRPMPGQDVEPLIERILSAAQACGLSAEIVRREASFAADPQSDFLRQMLQWTGTTEPLTTNFGTDASQLQGYDRVVILGPGSIAQAHTCDEYITLEQLARGTELFGRLIDVGCRDDG